MDCANSLYQPSKAGSDGASTDTFSVSAHSKLDVTNLGLSGGASHYSERSGSSLPRRDTALSPGVANMSLGGGTNPSFGYGCTSLDESANVSSFGMSTLASRSKCEESRGTLSFGAKVEAMSLPSYSSAEVSEIDGRTQIPPACHYSRRIPSDYHSSHVIELDGCRASADELMTQMPPTYHFSGQIPSAYPYHPPACCLLDHYHQVINTHRRWSWTDAALQPRNSSVESRIRNSPWPHTCT